MRLAMGLSDLWEPGRRTMFYRKLKDTPVARGRVLGGKIGKQARIPRPWSLPSLTVGRIFDVILGTETTTTSMMTTPSTPRPGASPPTSPLGDSCTVTAVTAAAWAARPACSPRPRPSPMPPSLSTCTAGAPRASPVPPSPRGDRSAGPESQVGRMGSEASRGPLTAAMGSGRKTPGEHLVT